MSKQNTHTEIHRHSGIGTPETSLPCFSVPSRRCVNYLGIYFCRFATHSRASWPSRSDLPVIVSSFSMPLYLVVVFWPLRSHVTLKLTVSPLIFASSIGVSVLLCPPI